MTARDVEKDRLNGISNGMQLGCKLPDDEQICPNDCECIYWDCVITTPIPCENLTITTIPKKCPECENPMTLADEEIEGQGKTWLCQECKVHIPYGLVTVTMIEGLLETVTVNNKEVDWTMEELDKYGNAKETRKCDLCGKPHENDGVGSVCPGCINPPEPCEDCGGEGWIVTQQFHKPGVKDGTVDVERCDQCQKFQNDDEARNAFAKKSLMAFWNNRLREAIKLEHATYCLDEPIEDCKKHGVQLEELDDPET